MDQNLSKQQKQKLYLHELCAHEGFKNLNTWIRCGLFPGVDPNYLRHLTLCVLLAFLENPIDYYMNLIQGTLALDILNSVKVLARTALNLAPRVVHSP